MKKNQNSNGSQFDSIYFKNYLTSNKKNRFDIKEVILFLGSVCFVCGSIFGVSYLEPSLSDKNINEEPLVSEKNEVTDLQLIEKQTKDMLTITNVGTNDNRVDSTKTEPIRESIADTNHKNDSFNENRYYCTHCDVVLLNAEASQNGSEYYGYNRSWVIPFMLRNIYIRDSEFLAGLFKNDYDLSTTEHVTEEYEGLDLTLEGVVDDGLVFPPYKTTTYTISKLPESIKGIPDDVMPDYIVIDYSPNGDLALGKPCCCTRVKFRYDDRPIGFNFEFIKGSDLNESELADVREYIDEFGLTD